MGSVQDILKQELGKIVTSQIKGFSPPGKSFSVEVIPGWASISGYECTISGGQVSSASAGISSFNEVSATEFTCAMSASLTVAYSDWHEEYDMVVMGSMFPAHFDNHYKTFDFSIAHLAISFTLSISGSNVSVTNASSSPTGISFNLPKDSALKGNWSCVQKKINENLVDSIQNTDFITPLKAAIEKALGG